MVEFELAAESSWNAIKPKPKYKRKKSKHMYRQIRQVFNKPFKYKIILFNLSGFVSLRMATTQKHKIHTFVIA